MPRLLISASLVGLLFACGNPPGGSALDGGGASTGTSGSGTTGGSASTGGSSGSTGGTQDAGNVIANRGPTTLTLNGDPEGLWWDAPSSTLYIADQENNQILTWTDRDGLQTYAILPGGAQGGEGLGQLVVTQQGLVMVVVFGGGTNGAIDLAFPDGGATTIAGLDTGSRRLGLTQAADGTLFVSGFVKNGTGSAYVGGVVQLTLTATSSGWSGVEAPVVTGLQKPVGVVASNGNLYITDQGAGEFLAVPISSLPTASPPVLASNLSLDLISLGPDGTFFTGSTDGVLNQLDASGNETAFVSGYHQPRGSAYDAVNTRVFFGDHISSAGQNQLVIAPVTQ